MKNFESVDYFTDESLIPDPHSYYDYLRSKGPSVLLPQRGVVAVTGYEEGLDVFLDNGRFSSFNSSYGAHPLPFVPEGDDITDQIEASRGNDPYFTTLSSLDPPAHTRLRSLLMGLFTPKRLQENEEFMWQLADRLIDEFIAEGRVELISRFAQPFATLIIAELLGVPEEDHQAVRKVFEEQGEVSSIEGVQLGMESPLASIAGYFTRYIEDRRRNPRKDVMTALALAKYPDGSLPPAQDAVFLATFLFAAGQETTVRVIGAMLRFLGEDAALQKRMRADRTLIPNFAEETLRMESAVKSNFRIAKVRAQIGDVEVKPGTPVMLCIGGMNRDPRKFESPNEFQPDRKNARDQLAFGRGIHSCVGAPLARAELRVTMERLLDRMSDIRIDDTRHGPAGSRSYRYAPSFLLRGLKELYLSFTQVS